MNIHWTERSIKDYLFRIAADFIEQLEKKMESQKISQDQLAEKLGITKGRVSQVLNRPGNITLASIIKYARTLGMKVSIVAYEDDDPENKRGPINSEIFKICWEKSNKPRDFWAFEEIRTKEETPADANRNVIYGRSAGSFYSRYYMTYTPAIRAVDPMLGEIIGTQPVALSPEAFHKDQKRSSSILDQAYKYWQDPKSLRYQE